MVIRFVSSMMWIWIFNDLVSQLKKILERNFSIHFLCRLIKISRKKKSFNRISRNFKNATTFPMLLFSSNINLKLNKYIFKKFFRGIWHEIVVQNLHNNNANVKFIYSFKSQFMIVRIRHRVNKERRVC